MLIQSEFHGRKESEFTPNSRKTFPGNANSILNQFCEFHFKTALQNCDIPSDVTACHFEVFTKSSQLYIFESLNLYLISKHNFQ